MLHGHLSLNGNAPTNDMQQEKEISIVEGKKHKVHIYYINIFFFFGYKKKKWLLEAASVIAIY